MPRLFRTKLLGVKLKLFRTYLTLLAALSLTTKSGYPQKVVQDSLESNLFQIKPAGLPEQVLPDTSYITLDYAIQEALANNDLLKKTSAQIKAGQARLQQAQGELLPRIDANFSYSYLDIVPGFRAQILGNIEHDLLPTVSITQPVYTGGKLKLAQELARIDYHLLETGLANELLNLKLTVAINYFQLQSLINQRQILLENRKQLEAHRSYSRLLVESGHMSQLELNRIDVNIATIDGSLLKNENDYQSVAYQLGILLGRSSPQIFVPLDSMQALPFNEQPESLVDKAFANNPVWRQFDWEMQKAETKVKIQQATGKPQVNVQAFFGYEFGIESFSLDKNKRYFWGLNAKIPLYDGKIIKSKINEAQFGVEQVRWQKDYFQKNLVTQIKSGYSRLQEKEQQILIQQQAMEQARQSHRLAIIEYNAGRRSNTDLLDIQKTLLNSQLALNQAVLDYNIARTRLLAVVGIL